MITGDDIRSARELSGMSQKELADAVGASERTIGNWERNTSVPRNREARIRQVLEPWLGQDRRPPLAHLSDVELLAEIARRFSRGAELDLREANEAVANLPAPTADELREHRERSAKIKADMDEWVRQHPEADIAGHEPPVDAAADDNGQETEYERQVRQQDEDAEKQ